MFTRQELFVQLAGDENLCWLDQLSGSWNGASGVSAVDELFSSSSDKVHLGLRDTEGNEVPDCDALCLLEVVIPTCSSRYERIAVVLLGHAGTVQGI